MKTFKYILFPFLFLILLVKEVGFESFKRAWDEAKRLLSLE
jgi:hypothetical protein